MSHREAEQLRRELERRIFEVKGIRTGARDQM